MLLQVLPLSNRNWYVGEKVWIAVRYVQFRNQKKHRETKKIMEGFAKKGQNVVVVEDLIKVSKQ
jgi:orotate phosphoribosyltransferase